MVTHLAGKEMVSNMRNDKMRTAITAASGKLGGEIVDATVALLGSENVVGLARTPSRAEHLGVEIRKGDYGNRDELAESLHDVDCLLLSRAWMSLQSVWSNTAM